MGGLGHLPGLPPQLRRCERRRHRRPARHHRSPRPPARDRCVARRGRHLALADLSLAARTTSATTSATTRTSPPDYGTLADLDALVAACHARGLRFLLDLVPCHTSIEHPVVRREPLVSRQRQARLVHLGRPCAAGGPPSNWEAAFGGSSWEWDAATQQYYLHSFYPEQPDLNWRNPAVAEAMAEVMRFWFRRGVDGFRVDAIFAAIKDDLLRDNPPDRRPSAIPGMGRESGQDPLWSMNRPEVHDVDPPPAARGGGVPGPGAGRRGLPAGRGAGRLSRPRRRRRVPPRLRLRAAPHRRGTTAT